jgi:hypothetical protein
MHHHPTVRSRWAFRIAAFSFTGFFVVLALQERDSLTEDDIRDSRFERKMECLFRYSIALEAQSRLNAHGLADQSAHRSDTQLLARRGVNRPAVDINEPIRESICKVEFPAGAQVSEKHSASPAIPSGKK